ncbi:flavin reductase family protein [Wenxinia saemankumensis]|uniref:NADH-FMN oxidoreductase RutF, flavin reductase (DIM6/NTAB) family n=1 Tax=Wenxinia saemankumensis TaxID=1447782 RepID=A0A1M6A9H7_9RHOB|nr:flavin reductase family protein [Wenxinia saemankumensis]SHI33112.1 NADH-FMN oxidoreductase RutF, flavin reductase (DIM6/NTAB) family [Wenxinia saemankumensis]
MTRFDPATDPRAFRGALGAFATGVCIVTTRSPEGAPVGITANSFASVSLDPPLVLWSPARASSRFELFAAAPRFAIHVLRHDQHPLSTAFTRDADPGIDWDEGIDGLPLLPEALAVFEAVAEARHPAGDHDIVVGRVIAARLERGQPLVFQHGAYGTFAALEGGSPPEG